MPESICGSIERVVFHNEQTGYMVARLKEDGKKDLTTITGEMAGIIPGMPLTLKGKWTKHKTYGWQFQVGSAKTGTPTTEQAITKYLGSGLIKGIGPVMAGRIVATFGTKTLKVLEEAPERLPEVEGIGEKRTDMITESLEEHKGVNEIMAYLQSCSPGISVATKIYRKYGKESIKKIQENPYQVARDINGIGFKTADRIGQRMGYPLDSPVRIKEGTYYALMSETDNGHVCYPEEELKEKALEFLMADTEGEAGYTSSSFLKDIDQAMVELENEERIVKDRDHVYPIKYYHTEVGIAKRMNYLYKAPKRNLKNIDVSALITKAEKELGIVLAEKQKEAVTKALSEKILVVTGGPGTGKTTIVRSIVKAFNQANASVELAAPTGRAAKRMEEVVGQRAQTLHRLLGYDPRTSTFVKNSENPIKADVVIVDETSMVDLFLMRGLVNAVPNNGTLVLVGDVDQLPSVGAGNILGDVISSNVFPVVFLNEIFRQSQESKIICNAHRINAGKMPNLKNPKDNTETDFYFVKEPDADNTAEIITELVTRRIPGKMDYDPINDIQVLCPMRKGVAGVNNLNSLLQESLNSDGEKIPNIARPFRVGDKVMQVRNNYDLDVFNGDIGTIQSFDLERQEIYVNYDGEIKAYDFAYADEMVLAYATSIHKSQGSEYSAVVVPVLKQHYIMLRKKLLYTAVTRGKKMVVMVGDPAAVGIAVNSGTPADRHTFLNDRLIEA